MSISMLSFAFGVLTMIAVLLGVVIVIGIIKVNRIGNNLVSESQNNEKRELAVFEEINKVVRDLTTRETNLWVGIEEAKRLAREDYIAAKRYTDDSCAATKSYIVTSIADTKSYIDRRIDTVQASFQNIRGRGSKAPTLSPSTDLIVSDVVDKDFPFPSQIKVIRIVDDVQVSQWYTRRA